ncbi:MAG: helix-turn-helix domain-containing protein [bacterium]
MKKFRIKQGYTQEELSLECGYDRTYIGKIERGSKDPSMESIVRLSDVLNIPASYLFEDNREPNRGKQTFLAEVVQKAKNFIVITDLTGCILQMNEAFIEFANSSREALIGKSILEVPFGKDNHILIK